MLIKMQFAKICFCRNTHICTHAHHETRTRTDAPRDLNHDQRSVPTRTRACRNTHIRIPLRAHGCGLCSTQAAGELIPTPQHNTLGQPPPPPPATPPPNTHSGVTARATQSLSLTLSLSLTPNLELLAGRRAHPSRRLAAARAQPAADSSYASPRCRSARWMSLAETGPSP